MSEPASMQPAEQLMTTWNAAAEEGRSILTSSFRVCAAEIRTFFEDLAKDDAEAAIALTKCQTPLDFLAVQQKWLAARAEACMSAGLRMALAAVHEPEAAAAEEAGAWRLPE